MRQLLVRLGFEERIRGSHHIFTQDSVEEILNLQPKQVKAKAYQVKQVRNIIVKYQLGGLDDDEV
jgi:predicted RNA binding protein YcfA (HicA-like mRNA interferase family)